MGGRAGREEGRDPWAGSRGCLGVAFGWKKYVCLCVCREGQRVEGVGMRIT